MGSSAFERHYRIKELAGLWSLSPKAVARIFADQAGVIRIVNEASGKRKHVTLSIPESVALIVHERLGKPMLPANSAKAHAPRIIRLRDLDDRLPKKARNVVKVKALDRLYTANASRK